MPAVALAPLGLWARARRWRYLFPPGPEPPGLVAANMIGYMGNNVLPLRAGEFVRIYVVARRLAVQRDGSVTGGLWLAGATIVNLSPAVAEELGVDDAWDGVMVLSIARGSPARRLGLKPGDVLLEVGGREVKGVEDVKDAIAKPADSWRLSIRRGGQIHTIVLS